MGDVAVGIVGGVVAGCGSSGIGRAACRAGFGEEAADASRTLTGAAEVSAPGPEVDRGSSGGGGSAVFGHGVPVLVEPERDFAVVLAGDPLGARGVVVGYKIASRVGDGFESVFRVPGHLGGGAGGVHGEGAAGLVAVGVAG